MIGVGHLKSGSNSMVRLIQYVHLIIKTPVMEEDLKIFENGKVSKKIAAKLVGIVWETENHLQFTEVMTAQIMGKNDGFTGKACKMAWALE